MTDELHTTVADDELSDTDVLHASLLAFVCILKGIPGIVDVNRDKVKEAILVMAPLKAPGGYILHAQKVVDDIFKRLS